MITTGQLTANLIRAGILQDVNGDNYWNLESGQLVTTEGSIGGFIISPTKLSIEGGTDANKWAMGMDSTSKAFYVYRMSKSGSRVRSRKIAMSDYSQLNFYYAENEATPDELTEGYSLYVTGAFSGEPTLGLYDDNSGTLSDAVVLVKPGTTSDPHPVAFFRHVYIKGNLQVDGDLAVTGTKPRAVKTPNYTDRLLYCYETPTPLFGDIGEAMIDEDGFAYVDIDDIFSETVAERVEYQVFLQKEGQGDCWIAEKTPRYFVIQGTPTLKVAWELKAKQRDYENIRLERTDNELEEYANDSDPLVYTTDSYFEEQEALLYG